MNSAFLGILSNDPKGGESYIDLAGVGIVAPEVAVYTGAGTAAADEFASRVGRYDFADVRATGGRSGQMFTIQNPGNTNLSKLAVSVTGAHSGDFLMTQPDATVLPPDATTAFTVIFRPTARGPRAAVVRIASDDADENPFEINVSGTGYLAEISVEQPAGNSLAAARVTAWGWNAFGQTNVPAGLSEVLALAAGDRHTVALKLDGTLAAWGGNTYGQTRVPSGFQAGLAVAAGGAHTAAVSGSGVDFGPQATNATAGVRIIHVRNSGDDALRIGGIDLVGEQAADFAVDAEGMPASLPAAGGEAVFAVRFAPRHAGVSTAVLRIQSSDLARPTFAIQLSGLGVGPNSPPVAADDAVNRFDQTRITRVPAALLLANDTDADSDPLNLTGVGNAWPEGATVRSADGWVTYAAPQAKAGNGRFEYTLSDGPGGHSTTGVVTVTEIATPFDSVPKIVGVNHSGGRLALNFTGVPGSAYRLQYADELSLPSGWTSVAAAADVSATDNGSFTFADLPADGSARFYRAVLAP